MITINLRRGGAISAVSVDLLSEADGGLWAVKRPTQVVADHHRAI